MDTSKLSLIKKKKKNFLSTEIAADGSTATATVTDSVDIVNSDNTRNSHSYVVDSYSSNGLCDSNSAKEQQLLRMKQNVRSINNRMYSSIHDSSASSYPIPICDDRAASSSTTTSSATAVSIRRTSLNRPTDSLPRRSSGTVVTNSSSDNSSTVSSSGPDIIPINDGKNSINNRTTSSTIPGKLAIRWMCGECSNSCIPIRSESRCLW